MDALTGVQPEQSHWDGYRVWADKGPLIGIH
jgi:hypothetical protein